MGNFWKFQGVMVKLTGNPEGSTWKKIDILNMGDANIFWKSRCNFLWKTLKNNKFTFNHSNLNNSNTSITRIIWTDFQVHKVKFSLLFNFFCYPAISLTFLSIVLIWWLNISLTKTSNSKLHSFCLKHRIRDFLKRSKFYLLWFDLVRFYFVSKVRLTLRFELKIWISKWGCIVFH